jgi:hypothetical protein
MVAMCNHIVAIEDDLTILIFSKLEHTLEAKLISLPFEEKFMSKEKPDHQLHLVVLQGLLVANKFGIDSIPSLYKVKKQKRLVSKDLHPDRVGSERVEELKQFLNMNKELEDYLIEHELFVDDETIELFEDEDHLSMEDIERIMKKGYQGERS